MNQSIEEQNKATVLEVFAGRDNVLVSRLGDRPSQHRPDGGEGHTEGRVRRNQRLEE
jgi:hypothetical protein